MLLRVWAQGRHAVLACEVDASVPRAFRFAVSLDWELVDMPVALRVRENRVIDARAFAD